MRVINTNLVGSNVFRRVGSFTPEQPCSAIRWPTPPTEADTLMETIAKVRCRVDRFRFNDRLMRWARRESDGLAVLRLLTRPAPMGISSSENASRGDRARGAGLKVGIVFE
jgi:hypothetical protein